MAKDCEDYETCLSLSARLGYSCPKRVKKPRTRAQSLAITTQAKRDDSHTDLILAWLRKLPQAQRQSAVCVKDCWFTSILRQMFGRKVEKGEVIFKYREEDAKLDSSLLDDNFYSSLRKYTQTIEPSIALELSAEQQLEKALRLCDSEMYLDTLTVDGALLGEIEMFVDIMRTISGGKAFRSPCRARFDARSRVWFFESPAWLFSTYSSVARWAGVWLERGIWVQYWKAMGIDPRIEEEKTDFVWDVETSQLYDIAELTDCWSDIKVTLRNRLVEEAIDRGVNSLHRLPRPSFSAPSLSFSAPSSNTGYEQYQSLIAYYNQTDSLHELKDRIESGPIAYLDLLLCSSLDRAMSLLDFIARSLAMDIRNIVSRNWADMLLKECTTNADARKFKQKRSKKQRKMSDISSTSASLSSCEEEDAQSLCRSVVRKIVEDMFICKEESTWPFKRVEGKKKKQGKTQTAGKKRRNRKRGEHGKEKLEKNIEAMPPLHSPLHRQIESFVASIDSHLCQQQPFVSYLHSQLSSLCTSLFPSSSLHPYGSRTLSLALPSSDIDFALTTPSCPETVIPSLRQIGESLRRQFWVRTVTVLDTASVPIVKIGTDTIPIDISCEGPESAQQRVRRSELLKGVLMTTPGIRPVLLVLKHLKAQCGVQSAYEGYLSSYSLLLWTTAYLQTHPDTDMGTALLGFLSFYSQFDPAANAIDIHSSEGVFRPLLRLKEDAGAYAVTVDPINPGNNTTWNAFNVRVEMKLFGEWRAMIENGSLRL